MNDLIEDMMKIDSLGKQRMKQEPNELERFALQVWRLLNGVAKQAGDTVWADDMTTMHEAFIDVVNEFRPKLAAMLVKELEES